MGIERFLQKNQNFWRGGFLILDKPKQSFIVISHDPLTLHEPKNRNKKCNLITKIISNDNV